MTEANVSATPTWHAEDAAAVVAEVATDPQRGLSEDDARGRLIQHGPNRLAEVPPPHPLLRFARQFHHLLIYVLLGAAGITALLAQWVDSGVIVAVVLLNAVVGFIQEGKAERSLQAIRHLLAPRAQVLRDGRQHDVDAADLVPGDVVLLASGDRVPADVRLLQTRNLRVDEAALTGESVPVDKNAQAVAVDAAIGDRLGMAYAGTLVTQGQARAVVVATGERTEIGRIGRLLETVEAGPTPLLRKMAAFGRMLTFVILALAAALFAFGTWVRGYAAADMFMAAVGLAVAAIPEGLPAIMTITLAIGVQRMAARHAIVRRMPAVETLGSVTVICSDKTGTLTRNEMTVQAVVVAGAAFTVDGAGYAPHGAWRGVTAGEPLPPAARQLAQAGVLCNDAALHEHDGQWTLAGDPTEGALLTLAMKAGADPAALRAARPRLDVVPFESEHRYMATLHRASDDAAHVAYVKGAPERLLQMCAAQLDLQGSRQALDTGYWQSQIDAQARAGRRLLALALVDLPVAHAQLAPADVQHGLTLLGLVGIIDPPRDEAVRAVAQCREAGISAKMITGDHAVTAAAIAGQLGLADDGAAAVFHRGPEGLQGLILWDPPRRQHQPWIQCVSTARVVVQVRLHPALTIRTGGGVQVAIYKYMSAEIGLKYLRTWHLKYTPPRDFNDPFDVLPSIPTEYDLPFGDVRIPDNALAMLSESMAKARSTDPVKVATATSGLKFQGFNGEAEMRKTDHQMQQALYITAWTKADAKNPYSVENTGFNFQEVRMIPAHVASTPTSCQMKRP